MSSQPRQARIAVLVGAATLALALSSCSAPSGTEGTQLKYQSWRLADPGVIGELHNGWVDEYNESQDEVSVVGEEVPFDRKGDVLLNQILAGSPPDVVAVPTADVPQFAQYMLPLDEYYAEEGADFEQGFIEGARELVRWDDSYYGVAMEMGPVDGLYYNTEVLDRAGVDPEQAVRSWESFGDALAAIAESDPNAHGMVMAGADASRIDYFWAWYYGAGAPLGSEDELRENLCSPQGVQTFELLTDTFVEQEAGPSPVDIGFEEYVNTFAAGTTGFAQGGAWMNNLFIDANPELEGKLGVTHLPPREEGGEPGVILDAVALMIPRDAADPDAAWEFIRFLTSPEKQLQDAVEAGFLPTIADVAADPALAADEHLATYADLAVEYGFPRPRTTHLAEVRQAMWEEWQSALLGQKSAADAAQSACTAVDAVLG